MHEERTLTSQEDRARSASGKGQGRLAALHSGAARVSQDALWEGLANASFPLGSEIPSHSSRHRISSPPWPSAHSRARPKSGSTQSSPETGHCLYQIGDTQASEQILSAAHERIRGGARVSSTLRKGIKRLLFKARRESQDE